jgi:hypothetical protein
MLNRAQWLETPGNPQKTPNPVKKTPNPNKKDTSITETHQRTPKPDKRAA